MRPWNKHAGMKTQSINIMEFSVSVSCILNCAQALNISLHSYKRTKLQAGSHIPVIYHSTILKFLLRIDLSISIISIALPLVNHIEGAQINMGRNLCTTFQTILACRKTTDNMERF